MFLAQIVVDNQIDHSRELFYNEQLENIYAYAFRDDTVWWVPVLGALDLMEKRG